MGGGGSSSLENVLFNWNPIEERKLHCFHGRLNGCSAAQFGASVMAADTIEHLWTTMDTINVEISKKKTNS